MTDFDKFCFLGMLTIIFLVYLFATMPAQEYQPQTISSISKDISNINSNLPPVDMHNDIPINPGWLIGLGIIAVLAGIISIAVFGSIEAAGAGRRGL